MILKLFQQTCETKAFQSIIQTIDTNLSSHIWNRACVILCIYCTYVSVFVCFWKRKCLLFSSLYQPSKLAWISSVIQYYFYSIIVFINHLNQVCFYMFSFQVILSCAFVKKYDSKQVVYTGGSAAIQMKVPLMSVVLHQLGNQPGTMLKQLPP